MSGLHLHDNLHFDGLAPAWQTGSYQGEVVFNTGMTGYVESLTDPSYSGQILVFTYPLLGNYGVDTRQAESEKIAVSGIVVSSAISNWSHSGSKFSLLEWLHQQQVPLLTNVDTRALTKHLRTRGVMRGAIGDKPSRFAPSKPYHVGSRSVQTFQPGQSKTVILVDCGAKGNILQSLLRLPLTVRRVPYDYDYTAEAYDGVLISNGPGDPNDYQPTIAITKKALTKNKPVFGICLGSQIMGLAVGAKSYKLRFGHRGHNQPAIDRNGRCVITSQNHGYALDEKTLPKNWRVSFRNLNDNTVEGIRHTTKPFFSVQFHPEASPGPTDTADLFNTFYELL